MTLRFSRLYPFLFVAVPVLHIAAANPGESSVGDLLVVLAVMVLGCGLVYAVSHLAFAGKGAGIPALVTFFAVLWFFGYPPVRLPVWSHLLLVPLGLVATVAVVRWLGRRLPVLERLESFLTLTGALLVAWSVVEIGSSRLRFAQTLQASTVAQRLARPIVSATPAGAMQPRRDIYLIVLDEYANSSVLRERFGFDNRAFEDSLRQLGFEIPSVVQSNYVHTMLSLPSLLNASQLTTAATEVGADRTDPNLVNHLFDHSRVVRFLQARGYRLVFFPSSWWFATMDHPLANLKYRVWSGWDIGRELTRSELRRAVLQTTVLRFVLRSHRPDAEHVRSTLAGMSRAPRLEGPVFALAHLITPHGPYVFDRDCRTPPRRQDQPRRGAAYVDQLQCLNAMLLRLTTNLLRSSEVAPIILLQGDHGSNSLRYSSYPAADSIPASAARERLGAFGAYYLPAGGGEAFGDTVTVVNVLGNVLRHYFDADLQPEPDDRYLSLERSPYALHKVDPRWLAGGASGSSLPASSH